MKKNINISQFLKKFNEEYNFLYNSNGYVAGYDEALEYGDQFIKEHPDFVGEFAKYRGDFLSSDREVAAFAFALSEFE